MSGKRNHEQISSNNDYKQWKFEDFDVGKPLGRGRFGRVYLAKEKRTKNEILVAIKILFKSMLLKYESEINFKRECEIQYKLRHPNILRLYTWFHDNERIYLVLEFASQGTLLKKLDNEGPFNDNIASTFVYQITKALIYLHSLGIMHRDLKPENVLIGCFGEVKLADFGWSFYYNSESPEKNDCVVAGTLDYLPPEMINKSVYDMKVDNWCLGVMIYELLVGKTPFDAATRDDIYWRIANVIYQFPCGMKTLAKQIISKLLVKNPQKRMDLHQVIQCSWIVNYANKDESYYKYSMEID